MPFLFIFIGGVMVSASIRFIQAKVAAHRFFNQMRNYMKENNYPDDAK